MQRKQRVPFPTTNQPTKRPYVKLEHLEQRFTLLLQLLQHNFDKVLQRTKTRRK